ncbi:MAG TPA: citramalate synthase [Methylomirabilota bacterium]|nr:citramalate synthase [Methylomirabilota bacterium]
MKPDVELYDTTLRDGSQGEGVNFSVADKIRIAEKLDGFGVHFIEGGWPGSNPKDIEFFNQAKRKTWQNARLAAFGSTRRKNIAVEQDDQVRLLVEAGTPVVTIYGKTWPLHVDKVLGTTLEENLNMIRDTVRFLKDNGKYVIYDAEHAFDGYKADPDYALATWAAAAEAGADNVTLCDTNGGCLTREIASIVSAARQRLKVNVGIHTHNDIGLGVANALTAIDAGAVHVQGTVNGYGERTGNCNLLTVIANLEVKMGKRCLPEGGLVKLHELSQFVDEIANLRHDPRQPWVGSASFAHKGGTHVNAVQKLISSYEHADPALVGNTRRVLISDLAGRSNIVMKAQEMGFDLTNDTPELRNILTRVKDLEHKGYEFEAAEGSLAILIRKMLKHEDAPFKVDAYHVSMRRDGQSSICEATVKVRVGDKRAHTVAEGEGPVNALDSALRQSLIRFFPQLEKVQLTDYKVRILESAFGTGAKTRVLIESTDGHNEWSTVGVSENIIEASLQALVDSIEFYLLTKI